MVTNETPASAIGKKLWAACDYSDLQIATPTKTFDVHKAVVCTASPFFEAACKRDWKEARTGIVTLPEDEQVVCCLLQYMYGVDYDLCDKYGIGYEEEVMYLFDAGIAADKYGIPHLQALCQERIINTLQQMDDFPASLVAVAKWFYEPLRRQITSPTMLRAVVAEVAKNVQWAMEDNEAWNDLVKQPELLRDVVLQLSKMKPSQIDEADEDLTAEYLKGPKSR